MAVYSTDFEGTPGTLIPTFDPNFATHTGGVSCKISADGHALAGNTPGGPSDFCGNYYTGTVGDAQFSRGTLTTDTACVPVVTIRNQAGAVSFFYALWVPGTGAFAGEMVAGSATDWEGNIAGFGAGDTIEIAADVTTATTIYLKRNGTVIRTYTGKNALSGGKVGFGDFHHTDAALNSWTGGDVSTGTAYTLPVETTMLPIVKAPAFADYAMRLFRIT